MQGRATLKRHAQLVDRMASALGLDLEEETMRGHLTMDELTDAVLNCTGCTGTEDCTQWLATRTTPETTPPAYCRNAHLFAELRGA
jgi:hypothetical protein